MPPKYKLDASLHADLAPVRRISGVIPLLILLATVGAFVSPVPDTAPGDWPLAMEQALAQGLHSGSDIVFTYGPYAAVLTHAYLPQTDPLMLAGQVAVACGFALMLVTLRRGISPGWIVALLFAMTALTPTNDVIYMIYPLLQAILCCRMIQQPPSPLGLDLRKPVAALLMVAIALPMGVLMLTKGTVAATCGLIQVCCIALFAATGRVVQAALMFLTPLISVFAWWCMAGQPPEDLPGFFLSLLPIISGYSHAMLLAPGLSLAWQWLTFLLASLLLVSWFYSMARKGRPEYVFLLVVYAILLFLAFKSGYVRQDGHVMLGAEAILLVSLSVPLLRNGLPSFPVLLACLLAWYPTMSHFDGRYLVEALPRATAVWHRFGGGLLMRWHDPAVLAGAEAAWLKRLAITTPLPQYDGSSDIYPTEVSVLLASGNRWAPRPVFQSYSAYTPVLQDMNRLHLHDPHAPDNVFFHIAALNQRLPVLEDGVSWPDLLEGYWMDAIDSGFIHFRKRQTRASTGAPSPLGTREYQLGVDQPVPASEEPLFASFRVRPGWYGRLQSTLFRDSPLRIILTLSDGSQEDYAFMPAMAETSFLFSPAINTTPEFCWLASDDKSRLAGRRPVRFRIEADTLGSLFWQSGYQVSWQKMTLPAAGPVGVCQGLFKAASPPVGR